MSLTPHSFESGHLVFVPSKQVSDDTRDHGSHSETETSKVSKLLSERTYCLGTDPTRDSVITFWARRDKFSRNKFSFTIRGEGRDEVGPTSVTVLTCTLGGVLALGTPCLWSDTLGRRGGASCDRMIVIEASWTNNKKYCNPHPLLMNVCDDKGFTLDYSLYIYFLSLRGRGPHYNDIRLTSNFEFYRCLITFKRVSDWWDPFFP